MLVRGFVAESLGETGGSAFTKNCRPSSLTTLAICAFASFVKNDARKIAQRASVVRISLAVIAIRLIIRPLPWATGTPIFGVLPWGRRQRSCDLPPRGRPFGRGALLHSR